MKKEKEVLSYSADTENRISDSILVLDSNLQVRSGNQVFYDTFQYQREEVENKYIYELKKIEWNISWLMVNLENIFNNNSGYKEIYFKQTVSPLGKRRMALNFLPVIYIEKFLLLFIKDITEERNIEDRLYYRFAMEELVTNISNLFSPLHSEEEIEVKRGINCTLQAIGESIGVERCFIELFSSDLSFVEHTYEWCADGFTEERKNPEEVSFDYFHYSLEKNKFSEPIRPSFQNEVIDKNRLEEEVWLAYDNRSLLAIPLVSSKKLIGLFGFSVEKEEKIWRREDIRLLKLVGEILVEKILGGLLPICASCKKVRDDNGCWHNVEVYMAKYTEAEFTHGLCQECLKNLYPDFSRG